MVSFQIKNAEVGGLLDFRRFSVVFNMNRSIMNNF